MPTWSVQVTLVTPFPMKEAFTLVGSLTQSSSESSETISHADIGTVGLEEPNWSTITTQYTKSPYVLKGTVYWNSETPSCTVPTNWTYGLLVELKYSPCL